MHVARPDEVSARYRKELNKMAAARFKFLDKDIVKEGDGIVREYAKNPPVF
jgi:hypothetical protein